MPLDQARYLFDTRLALAHYANGDLEAAVRSSLRARNENPNFSANLRFLAAALGGLGRRGQAQAVVADLLRLEPDFRLSAYERGLQPFTDTALRERFLSDLRTAGVQP